MTDGGWWMANDEFKINTQKKFKAQRCFPLHFLKERDLDSERLKIKEEFWSAFEFLIRNP